jgi:hypothetical protein
MGQLSDAEKATLVELLMKVNANLPVLWRAAGKTDRRAQPAT